MPDHWRQLLEGWKDGAHHLPFITMVSGKIQVDWSAVVQGLVIAAITTVSVSQVLIARLEEQTKALTKNFDEFKNEAKERLRLQEQQNIHAQQERIILRERVNNIESYMLKKPPSEERGSKGR